MREKEINRRACVRVSNVSVQTECLNGTQSVLNTPCPSRSGLPYRHSSATEYGIVTNFPPPDCATIPSSLPPRLSLELHVRNGMESLDVKDRMDVRNCMYVLDVRNCVDVPIVRNRLDVKVAPQKNSSMQPAPHVPLTHPH